MANEIVATIDNDNDTLLINFSDHMFSQTQSNKDLKKTLTHAAAVPARLLATLFPTPPNFHDPLFTLSHNPTTALYTIHREHDYRSYSIKLLSTEQIDFAKQVVAKIKEQNFIDQSSFDSLNATLIAQSAKNAAIFQLGVEINSMPRHCTLELASSDVATLLQKMTVLNDNEAPIGIKADTTAGTLNIPLLRSNTLVIAKLISAEKQNLDNTTFKINSQDRMYNFNFLIQRLNMNYKGQIPASVTHQEGIFQAKFSPETTEALLYFIAAASCIDPTPVYSLHHNAEKNTITITYNQISDYKCDFDWLETMLINANNQQMPKVIAKTPHTITVPVTKENAEPLFRYIKEMSGHMNSAELGSCLKVLVPLLAPAMVAGYDFKSLPGYTDVVAASNNNNSNASAGSDVKATYQASCS